MYLGLCQGEEERQSLPWSRSDYPGKIVSKTSNHSLWHLRTLFKATARRGALLRSHTRLPCRLCILCILLLFTKPSTISPPQPHPAAWKHSKHHNDRAAHTFSVTDTAVAVTLQALLRDTWYARNVDPVQWQKRLRGSISVQLQWKESLDFDATQARYNRAPPCGHSQHISIMWMLLMPQWSICPTPLGTYRAP